MRTHRLARNSTCCVPTDTMWRRSAELAKNGTPDPEVFDLAQLLERALLTHNAEDFHALHRKRPGHQGIIAVYRDADPRKNMNHTQIAAAIRRLETLRVTIAGDFHVLNH
jgi:hypothetical protein